MCVRVYLSSQYTNGYAYNYTTLVAKVTADHVLADPKAFLVYVAPVHAYNNYTYDGYGHYNFQIFSSLSSKFIHCLTCVYYKYVLIK